ncbi:7TM diverse intracellular signaling domain-containing protein [Fulvivirgaceae bacterium BMA10]|uniref:7TM diverse intracellular signaling domain-containing protein n=1 Tax=Splendidivirga corallicola TaxID=3051826 RepID=A0ABT8KIV6_9BACT|nr:7TM diverse intracellular signaling domain-containing protein [Fulvivirgaceae bacterium BMA10]
MKRINALFIAAFLFLISCQSKQHLAEQGVIHFEKKALNEVQLLNGQWEFYWDQFLKPEDFQHGSASKPVMVDVPNTWTVYTNEKGETFPDFGFGTYKLHVQFSEPTDSLGLFVPKIWSANKVWVNGNLVSQRGNISKANYENLIVENFVPIGKSNELEIIVQVSNYSLFVGGVIEPFKLANYDMLSADNKLGNTFSLMWIGCVLIMGLYHFILYFYIRKVSSLLYFGIACILIVIKLTVFGAHDLYIVLKTFNELLSFKWQSTLYYVSTYMLVAIGLLYMRSLYPLETNNKFVKIFFYVTSVYSFFLIITPVSIFSPTILPFQVIMFIGVIYLFYVIARATVKKRKESAMQAFGMIIMIFAALNDTLHEFGIDIIGNSEFVPVGFGFFLSLQFVVIAKRFANVYYGLESLSNHLEEKVIERTQEVTRQKEEIEKQNGKIKSSINYAQRIQNAMLPTNGYIKEIFPQSFILFRPRDVVSGDFYFVDEIRKKDVHLKIAGAIDCTGHGVPGALMSMIGNTLLHKIIHDREIHCPAEILTELNIGIKESLKQDITANKDGMDLALTVLNCKTNELYFSGASLPLVYVKNGELHYVKGDKIHIGGIQKECGEEQCFTRHTIKIDSEMVAFMFSDGYQDQIGGPEGRKFMIKKLRELLFENYDKHLIEQKEIIDKTLLSWIGENNKQIDDILVMGFKVAP